MRKIIVILLVVLIAFACNKNNVNTNSCDYDACAIKATAAEITQLESYLSGAGITTAVKHCSGMYYKITSPGADKAPGVCSSVSVYYTGKLTNGSVVDQTTTSPISFTLISLIEGWKKGIPLIKKGGKITLYLPPSLGYGSAARTGIPANSILIFDIELVNVL